jgi:hypothetical protein
MIRPWGGIRRHYVDLASRASWLEPIKALVDQIEASPTLSRLHAWTSVIDLHIVQTLVTYPYDGPVLVISPRRDGSVEFRYVDTMIRSKQWNRVVPGTAAFVRLQWFTDQLHWLARYGEGD